MPRARKKIKHAYIRPILVFLSRDTGQRTFHRWITCTHYIAYLLSWGLVRELDYKEITLKSWMVDD